MAGLASAHALCLVPKEPGYRFSSCSKLFVQCWALLWSPKSQDMGSAASPSFLCNAGLCFGPQKARIWVQQLLQALCVMLGFALVPKEPVYGFSSCSKHFVQCWALLWSLKSQDGSSEQPLDLIPVGPCPCSHHSADVLCIFCPSSPLVGHGVSMCMDASFPEGLLEFGDAVEDPEGWTPALRDAATHLVTLPAWHG